MSHSSPRRVNIVRDVDTTPDVSRRPRPHALFTVPGSEWLSARRIRKNTEKNDGGTFLLSGKSVVGASHGRYAYNPDPTTISVRKGGTAGEHRSALRALLAKHPTIGNGKHFIGTWKRPDNGKTDYDMTLLTHDKEEARRGAKASGQNAFRDLLDNLDIDV